MIGFIKKLFGTKNEREVKRIESDLIPKVYAFEKPLQSLQDDELRAKTATWKEELTAIKDDNELAARLDQIMPEAFAVAKEASRRLTKRGTIFELRGHEQ